MTTTAMVLVGGLGARLRPLTFCIPKPLLPVGERPIVELMLERLAACGFEHVVLATGYQADLMRSFCGDGSRFGVRVSYVHEEKPLGTAGPLSLLDHPDDVLLVNGDVVTDFDLGRLLRFRRDGGYDLAVGFTRQVYESPFGVLSLDGDDVVGIVEKPSWEQVASAGIYAIGPAARARVPAGAFLTMPQLIESVVAGGGRVGAMEITDRWFSVEELSDLGREVADEA